MSNLKKNSSRGAISQLVKFYLILESQGFCKICNNKFIKISLDDDSSIINNVSIKKWGQIAHIISVNEKNVRPKTIYYDCFNKYEKHFNKNTKEWSKDFLNSFDNLIYLCANCHLSIDKHDGKLDSIKYCSKLKSIININDVQMQVQELKNLKDYKIDISFDYLEKSFEENFYHELEKFPRMICFNLEELIDKIFFF